MSINWHHGSGWRWDLLQPQLSTLDMVKVASTSLCSELDHEDSVGWLDSSSSNFIVKGAYDLANNRGLDQNWEGWSYIWSLKIQQRIKVFLRLMAHERLLTNRER